MKKDNSIQFYIISESEDLDFSKFDSQVFRVLAKEEYNNSFQVDKSEFYGKAAGLYYIWKNCSSDYIGFSMNGIVPGESIEEVDKAISSGTPIIRFKNHYYDQSIREEYKDKYYDYDINAVRRYFVEKEPVMEDLCEKALLDYEYIVPSFVFRKDVFRKLCVWLFPILERCGDEIYKKRSNLQNCALEYIAYFLITLYILYFEKKNKTEFFGKEISVLNDIDKVHTDLLKEIEESRKSLIDVAQDLVDKGEVELAIDYVEQNKEHEQYKDLHDIFADYTRQRRHFSQTDLDKCGDLSQLIVRYKTPVATETTPPKVLIMVWDSVNNDDTVEALKRMGFDCETIDTVGAQKRSKEYMDRFVNFLDAHHYDLVFSINYFEYISEACYIHEIPYIAWAYDSPSNMGDPKYLKYDTTTVFLMDTDEVERYVSQGYKNIYYLPLAVNIDKYDAIKCSNEEIEKYTSDISFVGRLYSTKLTEYLNYLTDYKKGFFNALLDYNTGNYDSYAVEDVFSRDISSWLDEKPFRNAVYKSEKEDPRLPLSGDNMVENIIPRIGLLTNMTITNRERIILISMLSNHWEFKLYSDKENDLFKNAKQCGRVDYYTEMPKVFKYSKINLNITFKSIKTGIPLRCLDIMGCGGLLLTNYQRDFDIDFKDGENIAIYHSLEEAYEKCKFYMENDEIRKRVALNGYMTIKEKYTYETQLTKAFEYAGLEHLLQRVKKEK